MMATAQPAMTAAWCSATGAMPVCVVVTGPRGAGKSTWVQQCIRAVHAAWSDAHCAVLLAEEGRTRMDAFCAGSSGVSLRKLFVPCPCCPAALDLPGVVKTFVAETGAGWLFLELPLVAAPGLLGEFDRHVGIPRAMVMRLTPSWAKALHSGQLSPFQSELFAAADAIITNADEAERAARRILSRQPTSLPSL